MSAETRELLGVLVGAIPWIALVAGLLYSMVADRDRGRVAPSRRLTGGWAESTRLASTEQPSAAVEQLAPAVEREPERPREPSRRPSAVHMPATRRARV
ncbi:MAG: hypothetical protein ACRDOS_06930 [Gaiellaceae bacterium]